MKIQKSFDLEGHNTGVLYVVGTPIGNLDDLSPRVKETLESVDIIAAEDTRHTQKILSRFNLTTKLVSYHQHNLFTKGKELITFLLQKKSIALVSDAGLPGVSDPGEELIREAIAREIPVVPVPGPNAALTALIASGIPPQPFLFIGFLPRQKRQRIEELQRWSQIPATLIFYEAPHRLISMLKDVYDILGDRDIVLARELTKRHEEWGRGKVAECLKWLSTHPPRGEYTIVVSGSEPIEINEMQQAWWGPLSIEEHVDWYIRQGKEKKAAIAAVAADRSKPRREVYNLYHQRNDEHSN